MLASALPSQVRRARRRQAGRGGSAGDFFSALPFSGGCAAACILLFGQSLTVPLESSSHFEKIDVFFMTNYVSDLFCVLRFDRRFWEN